MLTAIIDWARDLFNRIFETEIVRRIVKNSGYLFSATGFNAALGMVQGIFIARMLEPSGLGLYSAIKEFSGAANRIASFRINEMVVRYVRLYEERDEQEKAAAVFKAAGLFEISGAFLAFLLVWWLAPLGAKFFADGDLSVAPIFALYGVVVLVNFWYDSSTGLLQVFDLFRPMALVSAIQGVVTLGLFVVIFINGGGLFEVILVTIAGKLIGAIGITGTAFVTAARNWGAGWWRAPLRVLSDDWRGLLTFAFSTNISGTISLVAKNSESLWISAFLGTTTAGYYNLASRLVGMLQLPVSPLPNTTYPELSREIARREWKNVAYILQRGSLLAGAYSLPVILGLVVLGNPFIELYAGSAFLPAYPILIILMVGYTFDNIFYWNRVALLAFNRPVFPTVVNFIGMLLKVGGIFLLVPRYDYLQFGALLSGYMIFTAAIAAGRVWIDLNQNQVAEVPP